MSSADVEEKSDLETSNGREDEDKEVPVGDGIKADIAEFLKWATARSQFAPLIKYRPQEARVAKHLFDLCNIHEFRHDVQSLCDAIHATLAEAFQQPAYHRAVTKLRAGGVACVGDAWQKVLAHAAKLTSNEPTVSFHDTEVTSSVWSSLVDELSTPVRSASIAATASTVTALPPLDEPAVLTEQYHGGWCIMAVRREVEASHRPDKMELLSLIPQFGKDVESQHRPSLETFPDVIKLSTSTGEVSSTATSHDTHVSGAKNAELKNTFVLSPVATPLFRRLQTITHSRFKTVLSTMQQHAVKVMQDELLADDELKAAFKTVVADKTSAFVLLEMIVEYFMKSKQKQLIRMYGLAPSKQSVSLRSSLRHAQKPQKASMKEYGYDVTAIKEEIRHNNMEEAVARLIKVTNMQEILDRLTVAEITLVMKHLGEAPASRLVKAQRISRLLQLVENRRPSSIVTSQEESQQHL